MVYNPDEEESGARPASGLVKGLLILRVRAATRKGSIPARSVSPSLYHVGYCPEAVDRYSRG
jgi:hypothetical protein